MEDKLSKILYELNEEYIKLINSKEYRRALNFKRLKYSISNMNFQYLIETVLMKIFKKKYTDCVNYTKTNTIETDKIDNFDIICKNKKQNKIVIYTCIIGGYDEIIEPAYCSINCDYYIVTDKEVPQSSTWNKIDINKFQLDGLGNSEKNRFIKLHPHLLFSEYDYSLYIDGNIRIMADVVPLVQKIGINSILGVHRHNLRDCIYTEANVIMLKKRFAKIRNEVKKQMVTYKREGFQIHQGLYENPILIRKHNDKRCINLMETWWDEMNRFATRDQLSLPYVIWKCGIKEDEISVLGNDLRMNPRFRQYEHNTVR